MEKSSENPCTEEEAPIMYKRHNGQLSLYESPEMFGGLPLNPENDWVKLGQMLPGMPSKIAIFRNSQRRKPVSRQRVRG